MSMQTLKKAGLTTLGFAVGGAVGMGVAVWSAMCLLPFIGTAIGGTIAGYLMGLAIEPNSAFIRSSKRYAITSAWALAGGIAGFAGLILISPFLGGALELSTAVILIGSVGGIVGGFGTTRVLLDRTEFKKKLIIAISWAIGGSIGGAVAWLVFYRISASGLTSTLSYATGGVLGGAAGGALGGAIGGSITFWQLPTE